MSSKISRVMFCGLRRINPLVVDKSAFEFFGDWANYFNDWYEFKKINVLIGSNGAGKSTVLELLDLIRDPSRLSNLGRENRTHYSLAAFMIDFSNDTRIQVRLDQVGNKVYRCASNINGAHDHNSRAIQLGIHGLVRGKSDKHLDEKILKNINRLELDTETVHLLEARFKHFDCSVSYWSQNFSALDVYKIAPILNDAKKYLTGVSLDNPVMVNNSDDFDELGDLESINSRKSFFPLQDNRIGIFLSDDLLQYNTVHVSALPSGWKQMASIILWLREEVNEGGVCLIEEPETHLHPRLQRYLARVMSEIVIDRKLQLFLTTHSSVFQNKEIWRGIGQEEVWVFEATGDRLEKYPNISRVLDDLGILASDISQCNGVIWVEGPTDRLYIKHWLSVWCHANDRVIPIENVDYSFCFYGGAILSHFEVAQPSDVSDDFINLLGLNRNFAIVMDRDNDFQYRANQELICLNPKSAKQKILETRKNHPSALYWVTHGYTIENYIKKNTIEKYFCRRRGRFVLRNKSLSKTEIARKILSEASGMMANPNLSALLDMKIEMLFNKIKSWNHF